MGTDMAHLADTIYELLVGAVFCLAVAAAVANVINALLASPKAYEGKRF